MMMYYNVDVQKYTLSIKYLSNKIKKKNKNRTQKKLKLNNESISKTRKYATTTGLFPKPLN